jgi:hypothetical protein
LWAVCWPERSTRSRKEDTDMQSGSTSSAV